ncbi:MAG: hypothetical protein ACJAUG_003082 [Halioglobus sp.]|jgi:hypothetical protein
MTLTTSAFASDGAEVSTRGLQIKPYTAQYVTKTRGLSITIDRELIRKADDTYELTSGGSKFIAGFKESSHFSLGDSNIIPVSYVYQGSGLMNRRREVKFTPGADTLQSLYKDKWYELPYTNNTYDRMTQQEQMRLRLMGEDTAPESVILTIADGKRIKNHQLQLVAKEKLETPMGMVDTVHYQRLHKDADRKSDIWLAPQWDYLMVKTLHVENGSPVEVDITNATIEGIVVTGE